MSLAHHKRHGIIQVLGSSRNPHTSLSHSLGRRIALAGLSVMTSGEGGGVAMAVAEGFMSVEKSERRGESIAVIWSGVKPGEIPGYPNRFVEVPVSLKVKRQMVGEHQVHSRNHGNEADVVIALPGESGTSREIKVAGEYEHPTIVHGPCWSGQFPKLWDFTTVDECMDYCAAVLRDRDRRPEVHSKKAANVACSYKTGDLLRREESGRVIAKKEDNERWVREEEERESLRKKGQDGEEGEEAGKETAMRKV